MEPDVLEHDADEYGYGVTPDIFPRAPRSPKDQVLEGLQKRLEAEILLRHVDCGSSYDPHDGQDPPEWEVEIIDELLDRGLLEMMVETEDFVYYFTTDEGKAHLIDLINGRL